MTDLTKDWKDGKLSAGWYWVKGSRTKGIYAYTAEYMNNTYRPINGESVLAPVPTFEEWQASEKYNKYLEEKIKIYERKDKQATDNELLEENTKLKERNDSLNNRDINLCRIANGIRDENFSLKELMKECIPYFNALVEKRLKLEYIPQVYELLTKINEVLK